MVEKLSARTNNFERTFLVVFLRLRLSIRLRLCTYIFYGPSSTDDMKKTGNSYWKGYIDTVNLLFKIDIEKTDRDTAKPWNVVSVIFFILMPNVIMLSIVAPLKWGKILPNSCCFVLNWVPLSAVSNVPTELPQVNRKVNAKIQSEVFFFDS